jgi:tetratricopeptide repeat protein/suppressor of fused protein SUFU
LTSRRDGYPAPGASRLGPGLGRPVRTIAPAPPSPTALGLVERGLALLAQGDHGLAGAHFERAAAIAPGSADAWEGLGRVFLAMGRPHEAVRAFDRAVGASPDRATALWGGALVHAELNHGPIAQHYLRRALQLRPDWAEHARSDPHLSRFMLPAALLPDAYGQVFGVFSRRTYHHALDPALSVDVVRAANVPRWGCFTYCSLGLANADWVASGNRTRVEIGMLSIGEQEGFQEVLANTCFHVMEQRFYPAPGTMLRDVIGVLDLGEAGRRLPHVYFAAPAAWGLKETIVAVPAIALVHAVPVSEAEYWYWREHGQPGFEALMERSERDFADFGRDSAI